MANTIFHRRRLPHWQPPGAILFVTFRTAGSLPKDVETQLAERAAILKNHSEGKQPNSPDLLIEWKKLFHYMDKQLAEECRSDAGRAGGPTKEAAVETPLTVSGCILRCPAAAQAVITSIYKGQELRHYSLHRYCVMPNHVHLLIEPLTTCSAAITVAPSWPPLWVTETGRAMLSANLPPEQLEWWPSSKILQSLKGASSRAISRIVRKDGPVWLGESFDHWVRDGEEYARIVRYIDQNPVVAGLCRRPEDWIWSTAGGDPAKDSEE